MISQQTILDAAVERNLPPSEYFSYFQELGEWQLQALQRAGLHPDHTLLDIGCGAMRLGIYAVPYLIDGFYCGADAFPPYIDIGNSLARSAELPARYRLLCFDDFRFGEFRMKFDFAISQSVFTHMPAEDVRRCIRATLDVMKPGGKLLFTYLIGIPHTQGFLYAGVHPMRRQNISHEGFFADLAAEFKLTFEKPAIDHPTQQVGLYTYP